MRNVIFFKIILFFIFILSFSVKGANLFCTIDGVADGGNGLSPGLGKLKIANVSIRTALDGNNKIIYDMSSDFCYQTVLASDPDPFEVTTLYATQFILGPKFASVSGKVVINGASYSSLNSPIEMLTMTSEDINYPLPIRFEFPTEGLISGNAINIKTGDVLAELRIAPSSASIPLIPNFWFYYIRLIAKNDLVIPTSTCLVNTNNLNVILPDVNENQLPTVGSSAGNTPFNVSINCSTPLSLSYSLSGNVADASQGVYNNIAPTSGVGVQVLDSAGNVIPANAKIPMGIVSNTTMGFNARYYKLANTQTLGPVNSVVYMDFTLN
ncbi:fimbrial protein (plasmid) [Serratia ureilytica]|uniref:fimbrial protein n=1 Tax=Serratia ureilytica TaxID=300181 RepID=UPI001CBCA06B|nr:fimbrial protein [Serratia ureilytica]UAN29730.1 fimbrial protein [Serratia ureilytica]